MQGEQTNAPDGYERRQYPRINAYVEYSVLAAEAAYSLQGIKNFSAGGVAFFSRELLAVGTVLQLAMDLPDDSHIEATAEVVWAAPVRVCGDPRPAYESGVMFIQISETARRAIGRFVFLRLER
ncbi:MAG: PilZ domain-containing protein [Candidatus Omnitrophica bacterium]|nr:PilZ domain-containing protein [Candidatus Omnitrophota bacterium]